MSARRRLPDGYGVAELDDDARVRRAGGAEVRANDRIHSSGSITAIDVSRRCLLLPVDGDHLLPRYQAHFVGQFSIAPGPFSAPGDSGSLVVAQGTNQPVGLLFAGGDGLTIAKPIDPCSSASA